MDWLAEVWNFPLLKTGDGDLLLGRLLGLLLIVVGAWWGAVVIERMIKRVARNARAGAGSQAAIFTWARIARYLVWIVATMVGLQYLGVDLASFALIGGAVGVGIGFGLQNIFSNFISGVILLLEKTLKVGDFVDLESGVRGHVREISLRFTRISTNDNVDVVVPNSEFVNGRVVNWTLDDRLRRTHVAFGVAYGTDKDAVREAALKAARRVESTFEDDTRKAEVWLVGMGESSLDFELVVWVGADFVARPASIEAKYLWAIHDELEQAGISIPFPQRDIHFDPQGLTVRLDRGRGSNSGTGGA
ncbi:MAG TPA: mechanosensitive ion channel domain-containing protein [Rhodocyclaceae bacterium]